MLLHCYSLTLLEQGDSPETWREEEFRMFEGGSLWKPPPLKNLRGKVIPPIMEIVKRGQLPSEDRDTLENMLRSITMERLKVKECMVWCIDHATSAEEVSDCLQESLCLCETPLPLKIARLYLLSDVLQNSGTGRSTRYRRIFEGKTIPLMEHLHSILTGMDSKLRAESFKVLLYCIHYMYNACWRLFFFVEASSQMSSSMGPVCCISFQFCR